VKEVVAEAEWTTIYRIKKIMRK